MEEARGDTLKLMCVVQKRSKCESDFCYELRGMKHFKESRGQHTLISLY